MNAAQHHQLPPGFAVRYLDPAEVRFERHGDRLTLWLGDREHTNCTVMRAFPLSDPARYVSVRGSDGREIGMIPEPDRLDEHSRELLFEQFRRRYVLPIIERIIAAKERFGTTEWEVQTNRGYRKFTTRHLRDASQSPAPGRVLFTDVNGNRYDVPDINSLDSNSRALLQAHL